MRIRSKISYAVLETLVEFGEGMLDAFFPETYSYAAISRPLFGLDKNIEKSRYTISSALWRLKQQGLVERTGPERASVWRPTQRGKTFLIAAKRRVTEQKADGIRRLVIFDIPERERRKQRALRVELFGCGFRPLQKSVWIGEHPLPAAFIALVDDLGLERRVHIFSVLNEGTLPKSILS